MSAEKEYEIKAFVAAVPGLDHPLVFFTPNGTVNHGIDKAIGVLLSVGFQCLVALGEWYDSAFIGSTRPMLVLPYLLQLFGYKDNGSPHFSDCRQLIGQKNTVPLDRVMPGLDRMGPKTIFARKPEMKSRVRSLVALIQEDADGQHSVRGIPVAMQDITNTELSVKDMGENFMRCIRSNPSDVKLTDKVDILSRKMGSSNPSEFELVWFDVAANRSRIVFRSNVQQSVFIEQVAAAHHCLHAANQAMHQVPEEPIAQLPTSMAIDSPAEHQSLRLPLLPPLPSFDSTMPDSELEKDDLNTQANGLVDNDSQQQIDNDDCDSVSNSESDDNEEDSPSTRMVEIDQQRSCAPAASDSAMKDEWHSNEISPSNNSSTHDHHPGNTLSRSISISSPFSRPDSTPLPLDLGFHPQPIARLIMDPASPFADLMNDQHTPDYSFSSSPEDIFFSNRYD